MSRKKKYVLTELAEQDLREARSWSMSRWGKSLTRRYLSDLHKGAEYVAQHHQSLQKREDLTGDTGLYVHAVREHYLVYLPLTNDIVAIVAVMRQVRDVPALLQKEDYKIRRELQDIKTAIQQREIKF